MRKLNIAIIGLGNIGSYLFKYLRENKNILTEKNNCSYCKMFQLKIKKEKEIFLSKNHSGQKIILKPQKIKMQI